jgi:hypothetical protein
MHPSPPPATTESPDLILLEDEKPIGRFVTRKAKREGLTALCVETSEALKEALAANPGVKYYILDNEVPDKERADIRAQVHETAAMILEVNPDAQIWSIGSRPTLLQQRYLQENEIPEWDKTRIGDLVLHIRTLIQQ